MMLSLDFSRTLTGTAIEALHSKILMLDSYDVSQIRSTTSSYYVHVARSRFRYRISY